jgi:DNA-binding PadR family transcriptional regulator
MNDARDFLPLNTAMFHILVTLLSEDRHGYGIMQEIERQSDGRYKLGPGTLYDNLQRLLDQGLVEESPRRRTDSGRQRRYRLTSLGREVVSEEIRRLERLFRAAKSHLQPRKA